MNTILNYVVFTLFLFSHYITFSKHPPKEKFLPNIVLFSLLIVYSYFIITLFSVIKHNPIISLLIISGCFFSFSDCFYLMISPLSFHIAVFLSLCFHLIEHGLSVTLSLSQFILICLLILINKTFGHFIGQGDIKLLIWWTFYFSPIALYTIVFFASIIGILYGTISNHLLNKKAFPFIPALVLGLFIYLVI